MTEKTFLLDIDETGAMTLVAPLGTAASIILASTQLISYTDLYMLSLVRYKPHNTLSILEWITCSVVFVYVTA